MGHRAWWDLAQPDSPSLCSCVMLPMFYNLATLFPCDFFNALSKFLPQGLHMPFPLLGILFPEVFAGCSLLTLRCLLRKYSSQRGLTASQGTLLPRTPRLSFSRCPVNCLAVSYLYLSLQHPLQGSVSPVICEHFCTQQLQEDFASEQPAQASFCCPKAVGAYLPVHWGHLQCLWLSIPRVEIP